METVNKCNVMDTQDWAECQTGRGSVLLSLTCDAGYHHTHLTKHIDN